MKKISVNSSWFFLLIPVGILFFVVLPQLQNTYVLFQKQELEYQQKIVELDSLQRIKNPSRSVKNTIKRLEISVPIKAKGIARQRYSYYKTGGMLVVLVFMFSGMFGASYWVKLKKNSSKNKEITFQFQNPYNNAVGRSVSWSSLENSGSNFLSERLKKTALGYKISASGSMQFVSWSFFLMGLNYTVWSFIEYYKFKGDLSFIQGGHLFFTSGGVFMLVGVFFFLSKGTKVVVYRHKRKMVIAGKILPFKDVYALQLLEKLIEGNSSGSYLCYELNIVTKQGERYNLLNHGDKQYLLSDMVKISKLLNVPIWNKGVL